MKPKEHYGARGFVLWILGWVVASHSHWPVLAPPAPSLGAARNRFKLPAWKRPGQHRPGQVCTWTRGLGVDLDGIYSRDEGLGSALLRYWGPLFPVKRQRRGQKWWVIYKRARAQPSEELSPDG